jgi:hypothetical protein
MSNRSLVDLTCSEVKQRDPIGMEYRADHAEHKFPGAPSASFDCHSSSLAFCSSIGGKWGERIRHDDDVSGVLGATLPKDFRWRIESLTPQFADLTLVGRLALSLVPLDRQAL